MELDVCPRWVLECLGIDGRIQHHISVFLSSILALAFVPLVRYIPHFCLMQKLFGVPCPGCGVCHSIMSILHLNPAAAWHANPAGLGVALGLLFQVVAQPIAFTAPRTGEFVCRTSRCLSNGAVASLMLVWIFRLI